MSKRNSLVRELLELEELRELKEVLKKQEPKKEEPKKGLFHKIDPVKLWIILVLAYPFVGPLYLAMIKLSVTAMYTAINK